MQRYFIKEEQIEDNLIKIKDSDFHHIKNVMRFKVGTELITTTFKGISFLTEISHFEKNSVFLKIIKELETTNNTINVTLAQSLIKKDKFELVLQKATELGVKEIIPLQTKNSIIKIDDFQKKKIRYETIVKEASEQSERNVMPKINDLLDIKSLPYDNYDFVFTAFARKNSESLLEEIKDIDSSKSVLVLIGPEGGFDKAEIEYLQSKSTLVSLGKTILRSETAAIYFLSALRLIWEK
jgi:16S rRNA (uracil1498-N3)-methyltransferase